MLSAEKRIYFLWLFSVRCWYGRFLWKCIKPFLANDTVQRFVFCKGTDEEQNALLHEEISPEELEIEYGGHAEHKFSWDEFSAEMRELEREMDEYYSAG